MPGSSSARTIFENSWSYLDRLRASAIGTENALHKTEGSHVERIHQALWLVFAVGIATRLSPLFDLQGRLFWQFMSEDGYLMQTIARNMAMGLGMSSSAGEIPTNGIQPLATFVFAGLHWIASGERSASIVLVTLLSALVAAATAYMLYRVARELLSGLAFGEEVSRFVAAIWFTGPLNITHSMNGLETGIYVLTMLGAFHAYLTRFAGEPTAPRWREAIVLGVLLGLTFLARIDAVFFIGALLVSHLLLGARTMDALRIRFIECNLAGAVSVLVGLPWLINNYLMFGSVMPISGVAQSFNAALAENLLLIPSNLLETMIPLLPIPRALETNPLVIVGSLAIIAGVLVLYWKWWGYHTLATRRAFVTTMLFGGALSLYYGLFFGAPWFVPRYLSILSPMLWFTLAVVAYLGIAAMPRIGNRLTMGMTVAAAAMVLFSLALTAHFFSRGTDHPHKQVVEWVRGNAGPADWVAAVQTGTLGYFHDRTLNLDGKVNPAALRELLRRGHIFEYVSASNARFIADWNGLSDWPKSPQAETFNRNFDLIVADPAKNLAVFRRKATQP